MKQTDIACRRQNFDITHYTMLLKQRREKKMGERLWLSLDGIASEINYENVRATVRRQNPLVPSPIASPSSYSSSILPCRWPMHESWSCLLYLQLSALRICFLVLQPHRYLSDAALEGSHAVDAEHASRSKEKQQLLHSLWWWQLRLRLSRRGRLNVITFADRKCCVDSVHNAHHG